MVDARNGEHTNDVETEAHNHRYPAYPNPQREKAGEVNRPEHPLLNDIHPLKFFVSRSCIAVVHNPIVLFQNSTMDRDTAAKLEQVLGAEEGRLWVV